jgi:O-6-methylguanine DNA methyltransferase
LSGKKSVKQHYLLTFDFKLTPVNRSDLVTLYFGIGDSPFGLWCIAWDNLGLVYSNMMIGDQERYIRQLKKLFSVTECITNNEQAAEYLEVYFQSLHPPFNAHIHATPFQASVWQQTCRIPFGETISYKQLGKNINCASPRAVGQALASNPIAFLIPCHRVIHASGELGNYSMAKHTLSQDRRKQIKSDILQWEKMKTMNE